jgi:cysteine synthase A
MITHFSKLVGNTPLIRLNKLSELSGCEIFGKAEFMNPSNSVKDRAALSIINDAVSSGALMPGGTIVEGTAGNTGIGLTLIGASMGFSTVIVIPETQTQEKKDALKNAGAQLIEVPAMPYSNANNYIRYSERLAVKLNELLPNGAYWANQFDNIANKKAHENTTAPEIYKQTNENIDAFVCSVGTGGTLSGVATGLRRLKPNIKIGLADPFGSALFSFFNNGELKSEGSSISEGIGQGRITKNLEGLLVDYSCQVSDTDALRVLYDLLYEEGMSVGISAGINMFGALQMAKTLNKGSTIVTVLCDHGMRYQSKIFNYDFLKMKNLPIPFWMNKSSSFIPDVRL